MEIVERLDYDTIGIVFEFLADNNEFFIVLHEMNLVTKDKNLQTRFVNWKQLSMRSDLPLSLIFKYQNELYWDILTVANRSNILFFRTFPEYINWRAFHDLESLKGFYDYTVFEVFSDKIDWSRVSRWAWMCEVFVDMFADKLNWDVLSRHQGLTEYLLCKYDRKINWSILQYNMNFSIDLKNKYSQKIKIGIEEHHMNNNNINVEDIAKQT